MDLLSWGLIFRLLCTLGYYLFSTSMGKASRSRDLREYAISVKPDPSGERGAISSSRLGSSGKSVDKSI